MNGGNPTRATDLGSELCERREHGAVALTAGKVETLNGDAMPERSGGKPERRVRPVSLYGDLARGAIWGGGGDGKDGIVGVLVTLTGLCDVTPELLERANR